MSEFESAEHQDRVTQERREAAAEKALKKYRHLGAMKPINPRELPRETVEKMGMNQFVSRNSLCPCGKQPRRRFKRCCGKEMGL